MPGKDGQDSTTDALRSDIKSAGGSMLTVESMSSAWKSGEAPPGDWMQKRFGPSPPEGLDQAAPGCFPGGDRSMWAVREPVL